MVLEFVGRCFAAKRADVHRKMMGREFYRAAVYTDIQGKCAQVSFFIFFRAAFWLKIARARRKRLSQRESEYLSTSLLKSLSEPFSFDPFTLPSVFFGERREMNRFL